MTGAGKRRPGGDGGNSRRFAEVELPDGSVVKVPAVKDAGTAIYLSDDYEWPKTPETILLADLPWMSEGVTFDFVEMRPGKGMGNRNRVVVVAVEMDVQLHPGKFGQVIRRVLVNPAPSMAELNAAFLGES